ncbi:unnamed protein product, partial [Prorocentrum cordatum]
ARSPTGSARAAAAPHDGAPASFEPRARARAAAAAEEREAAARREREGALQDRVLALEEELRQSREGVPAELVREQEQQMAMLRDEVLRLQEGLAGELQREHELTRAEARAADEARGEAQSRLGQLQERETEARLLRERAEESARHAAVLEGEVCAIPRGLAADVRASSSVGCRAARSWRRRRRRQRRRRGGARARGGAGSTPAARGGAPACRRPRGRPRRGSPPAGGGRRRRRRHRRLGARLWRVAPRLAAGPSRLRGGARPPPALPGAPRRGRGRALRRARRGGAEGRSRGPGQRDQAAHVPPPGAVVAVHARAGRPR